MAVVIVPIVIAGGMLQLLVFVCDEAYRQFNILANRINRWADYP